MVKPQARRAAVRHVQETHGLSERRACGLIGIGRSSLRYEARERDDDWPGTRPLGPTCQTD